MTDGRVYGARGELLPLYSLWEQALTARQVVCFRPNSLSLRTGDPLRTANAQILSPARSLEIPSLPNLPQPAELCRLILGFERFSVYATSPAHELV